MHAVSAQQSTQQFGRYELLAELGQGAMGVVYKARDPVLDRVVAVKTINLTLPKDELSEYEARFYQEARAAGGLNHPNIVTIYDIGKTERVAYMAMELLEGEELRSILSGPSIQARCLECPPVAAAPRLRAEDRGWLASFLSRV